ncbi:CDK5 regulatory subunit-associated protein 1 isoform X1 [Tachysurus ichikawai]
MTLIGTAHRSMSTKLNCVQHHRTQTPKTQVRDLHPVKAQPNTRSQAKREHFKESCSSDKESIAQIQGKAVETSEKDEGDVRDEEESEEIQGDIRLSEEEEEMESEVQEEMSQEKDRVITEEGAAGADIEYQIQGTSEQDINQSLLALQFPTDPAHVDQLKIQVNSDYIQFCCSLGPCQPVAGFPKNPRGRSFQSQWYAGNKWLEYSLEKDRRQV